MAKKRSTTRSTKSRANGSGKSSRSQKAPDATGKHLVIVESPTKARTINRYLGPDYVVMASVGHVRDLPSRAPKGEKQEVPGVDLEHDFEPTYDILPDKKKTVTELRKAAKNATDIWFATDLDREGEAIAWHLAEALGINTEHAKRVVFNAITKGEIDRAFHEPRNIDQAMVDAQQARRILDRIVGYQVSPLLWKKVAGGLSAGRVQSVATRLVVEREREIEAFVPDEYWRITGLFATRLDDADKLAPQWQEFLTSYEEKPRTVREQNAWLSEHDCLRAELTELQGKPFETDNRDDARKAAELLGFVLDNAEEKTDDKAKGSAKNIVRYLGHVGDDRPDYAIESIQTKRSTSKPGAPFITSTMQQAAANRLGFQLQRTMRLAQQLYEGINLGGARGQTGLITYMRTDSTHLSGDALNMARKFVSDTHGEQYLPEKPNFYSSSNKSAQEAHEAIRPTDVTLTPQSIRSALNDEQYKLYDLIWRRFVACQMTPAQWDSTTIMIAAKAKSDASDLARFKATGRKLVFDGFYKVMGVPTGDDVVLPELEEQQPLAPIVIDPTQHFTSPPARYTEASLQKKLEEEGIGRPSTYAAIIQTIQDREYVTSVAPRDRRLMATDLGMVVTDMLVEAFPKVMDVAYTREMEAELDHIEDERHDWRKMLREFYGPFREKLEKAHDQLQHAKAASMPAPYKCPKCGAATEYRFGKNGRFLSCTRFNVPPVEVKVHDQPGKYLLYKAKGKARPKIVSEDGSTKIGWTKLNAEEKKKFQQISDEMETCDYAAPIDRDGKPMEPQLSDIACPECGGEMTKRTGRFGAFLGCVNYPQCKGIVKLDPKKQTVILPKTEPYTTDVPCPKCDSPLYLRESKRGLWLSCSTFPKCRGRVGFSTLEEDKQAELEKIWAEHEKQNPRPVIRTVNGEVVPEGYLPKIAGEGEDDSSSDGQLEDAPSSDAA
ncbi:type I DNA topoisomerase [Phycisphaerales bacterium AB-hyl4]|uniref:DNA topoisomerase 1 n=1 Tax=Natronomicrosphaera hydrolytica TaxID=3242702 RepID=A0ABV4U7U8_9BACT